MSRKREERDYERGRGRDYEVEKERDKGMDRDRARDRARSREKGRDRDRDREIGRERGLSREKDRVRDREKERGISKSWDSGRERRERHGDMETRRTKRSRSGSPRVEPKGDRRSRAGRFSDSGRDDVMSPRPAAGAVANEDHTTGAENQSGDDDPVIKMEAAKAALEAKEKEKAQPTFEYSGKLAAETNKVRGVTLAFTEPPEARKPTTRWRLYVFKEGEPLNDPLYIHRQTCYLFGRERKVADVPTDHPSCSKQHAVIQYRLTEKEGPDGMMQSKVRPYLMDLGSTNGTFLNSTRIEAQRYYELMEQDTIKFGNSSREYVLLHENSAAS